MEFNTGLDKLSDEEAQGYLQESLVYDKEAGVLLWRKDRPSRHFKSLNSYKGFLKLRAGKVAGFPNTEGYTCLSLNNKQYYAHRLIYLLEEGEWPPDFVDHIDRDPSNNSWNNLRKVDNTINQKNKKMRVNNRTGVTGVSLNNRKNRWRARGNTIVNGKKKEVCILLSESFEECVEARKAWLETQPDYTETHGL